MYKKVTLEELKAYVIFNNIYLAADVDHVFSIDPHGFWYNKWCCCFCLKRSNLLDVITYIQTPYNKSTKWSWYTFCNESCFNCFVLKYEEQNAI
jgi:hypothetical protein